MSYKTQLRLAIFFTLVLIIEVAFILPRVIKANKAVPAAVYYNPNPAPSRSELNWAYYLL